MEKGVSTSVFTRQKWSSNANPAVRKQGVESIEQVARLCQSETEEVRNAARETTLSFGKSLYNLKLQILKKIM